MENYQIESCNGCFYLKIEPMVREHYSAHCEHPGKPGWMGRHRTVDYGPGDGAIRILKPVWCPGKISNK